MSTTAQSGTMDSAPSRGTISLSNYALRLIGLAFIDAIAVWLLLQMARDGVWPLAIMLLIITVAINAIFLVEDLYPIRWMAPGLALMALMVIYPLLFTVYIAFTNFGDGHLLTKQQAVFVLGRTTFLDEDAPGYSWRAYRSASGELALLLEDEAGEFFFAPQGQPIVPLAEAPDVGPLNEEGLPASVAGYSRATESPFQLLSQVDGIVFGTEEAPVQVGSLRRAAAFQQRYVYDPELDAVVDHQTDTPYFADETEGRFVNAEGQALVPGYQVGVGMRNFERIFTSPALRGPVVRVFVWTFVFALVSVTLSFALGLFLAILFDAPNLRGKKIIRSLLIIPYTIPAVISVLVWRGLLNPRFGPINAFLSDVFDISPAWFSDPTTAKIGILFINLWLGYPYMMLISSGALQAIPRDIYEAAAVDGANVLQQFRNITLPLLLISLGPLLISSFAFNLNNFNIIYLYNEGGPPISGAPTPAGHTDILISYTFRLAFGGGRGADYGFAAAITIIIFLIVASITFFQFRYTKMLEEVSENV